MGKLNRRLLPIKAHFFFFMGSMGPILPQLFVFGKQLGIESEVMGYILAVLPILYVLAKPIFGFCADYFSSMRKLLFMSLISVMTLAYAGFYFIPQTATHAIPLKENATSWNVTLQNEDLVPCPTQLLSRNALCSATRYSNCYIEFSNESFSALITDTQATHIKDFKLTDLIDQQYDICLLTNKTLLPTSSQLTMSCFLQPADHCIYNTPTFWLFICLLFIGTIGFNVTNSISDAICFDMLGDDEESKYGAQRVWGTIGFGLTAMLSGIVVDYWTKDAIKSFTPALVMMCVIAAFDLFSVSKLKMPKLSTSESITKDVWELVKKPPIAIFLVFATMAGIIDSFIIYFLFWHVEEVAAETGYMEQIKLIEGFVVAAECLAGEVPFFFYSGKIIKKLGYVHCMSMCFFFYAVRLGLIAWIPNPWYLVVVELFFQGITYALCYTCIVAYASSVAPPGTSATVQGLMAGMDDGLGFSIGALLGGYMFKRYHGRTSFMYISIAALITCILHILIRPTSRKRQYLPKSDYEASPEHEALADGKNVELMPMARETELLEKSKI